VFRRYTRSEKPTTDDTRVINFCSSVAVIEKRTNPCESLTSTAARALAQVPRPVFLRDTMDFRGGDEPADDAAAFRS